MALAQSVQGEAGSPGLEKPQCNVENLLETLDKNELQRFKSQLRSCIPSVEGLQEFPWHEVAEASGRQLAEILKDRWPSQSLKRTILEILEKMKRMDLTPLLGIETTEQMKTEELKSCELEKLEEVQASVVEQKLEEEPKDSEMENLEDVQASVIEEQMQGEEPKQSETERREDIQASVIEEQMQEEQKMQEELKDSEMEIQENVQTLVIEEQKQEELEQKQGQEPEEEKQGQEPEEQKQEQEPKDSEMEKEENVQALVIEEQKQEELEQKQGQEPEEQKQGQEPEEQKQGQEPEEQKQGQEPEEPKQGQEPKDSEMEKEENVQALVIEEQKQGQEPEEQKQGQEPEEEKQGQEPEEEKQGQEPEEQKQEQEPKDSEMEKEENVQALVIEEQKQEEEPEEQKQEEEPEEQKQEQEPEEPKQGQEPEEPKQGQEPEEQKQGQEPEEPKQGQEPEEPKQGQEPEEPKQGQEPEEQKQGQEPEEQKQGQEPEEQKQGQEPEEPKQGQEPEEPKQGPEPEEQKQGQEPEEQKQGPEPEEPKQGPEPEEPKQGQEPEEPKQGQEPEEPKQGQEPEEQKQGQEPEEPKQGPEPEEPKQGQEPEEPKQGQEPEEPKQGPEPEEPKQGPEPEEPKQGPEPEEPKQGPEPEEQKRGPEPEEQKRGPEPEEPKRGPEPEEPKRGPEPEEPKRGPEPEEPKRGPEPEEPKRGPEPEEPKRGPEPEEPKRGPEPEEPKRGPEPEEPKRGPEPEEPKRGPEPEEPKRGPEPEEPKRGPEPEEPKRGPEPEEPKRGPEPEEPKRGPEPEEPKRGPEPEEPKRGPEPEEPKRGPEPEEPKRGPEPEEPKRGPEPEEPKRGPEPEEPKRGPEPEEPKRGPEPEEPKQGPEPKDSKMEKEDVMEELVNVSVSLAQIWRNKAYIDGTYIQEAIERNHALIPFLDPQRALRPGMVVVYGPSGSGKTTLAKKLILEWAEGRLSPSFLWAFYLSCRELSGVQPCTFLELLCLACSELEVDAMVRLLEKPREALVVLDGFEEMAFPEWSPEDDDCTDWLAEKPVHVLLSNLLRGNLVPKATLVVTTRPQALRELLSVASQPLFLSIEGFSDAEKLEYFRRQFRDPAQARRALEAVKGNPVLRELSAAPEVCRALCACLRPLMRRGEDPALACRTSTGPFLHFLYNKFSSCSRAMSSRLEALCCLAVQGLWARMSVFYLDDLEKLGVKEAFLSPFLVEHIIQKDWYYRGYCYSFTHLSFQQLLAALFYLLKRKHRPGQDRQPWEQRIKDVRTLLSKEAQEKNPDLAQAGLFFFGLLGHKRSLDLEAAFGCQMVLETRLQELLECPPRGGKPFLLQTRLSQVFSWLYESQDEELVQEALAPLEEMSVTLKSRQDLLQASFCLQHCTGLRRLTLQVAKGLFPEDSNELSTYLEDGRFPSDILNLWLDLCSYVCSGKDLSTLSIKQSFLSPSSARALRESLTSDKCCVEEVVIQYLSPESCYQDLCLALVGKKSLLCLGLEGHVRDDRAGLLALLGQMLRNEQCCLQTLRLGTCSGVTPQAWADFFLAIQACQFLTGLDLKENEILDQGAKLLCQTLMQPLYTMQKLSLENCQLTQACCKDLVSVLIVSQQLIYLSLACNDLGDVGVKILCEGLSHPDCQLQTLVLRRCSMGEDGCQSIAKLLQEGCSLTSLDLSVNFIKSGLWMLCNALRRQRTKLRTLGLWGCAIRPLYCQELALVLTTNQDLTMLDLGQNSLGHNGIKVILEALKAGHTALKTLRLKMDELNQVVTLLKEVKHCHPDLVIEEVTNSSALSYWDFSPSP